MREIDHGSGASGLYHMGLVDSEVERTSTNHGQPFAEDVHAHQQGDDVSTSQREPGSTKGISFSMASVNRFRSWSASSGAASSYLP